MENSPKNYKANLIEAINTLVECDTMIFEAGLNLLMKGELKEIDTVFEEGDIYNFNIVNTLEFLIYLWYLCAVKLFLD